MVVSGATLKGAVDQTDGHKHMQGKFITFEGPEGGGKTTQAKMLLAHLDERGIQHLYTREPGGTSTGEIIRDILQHDMADEAISPEAELLLFSASRAQLVRHVIIPALEKGVWVVCDRFVDSTTAYQGYGRGFTLKEVAAINRFAIGRAIPDVTFLLDLSIEKGFMRVQARNEELEQQKDRMEREAKAFHETLRQGYLEMAHREPARFVVLSADRDPDIIADEIWSQTCERFLSDEN